MAPFFYKYVKIVIISVVLLIPFQRISGTVQGAQEKESGRRTVLLINSYHKGYLWTDEITRGVEETLHGLPVDLHIEYMDTKRQFKSQLFHLQAISLDIKHRQHKYDLIISSDDNAFQFLLRRKPNIFGDIPVVFCGVNYLKQESIQGYRDYTGINEKVDIQGNIALIRSLHPKIKKIVVVCDNTTTGIQNQKEISRVAALPENASLDMELISDVDIDTLMEKGRSFKNGTVVLFTVFIRDKNDRFFEYEQVLEQFSSVVTVPLYAAQNFTPGMKIIGGYLTNGYDQGKAAADLAKKIMGGTPADQVPIVWNTPTHPRFDYRQIQRHGIDIDRLPETSEVLFKPVSFYEENRLIILATGLIFILLLCAFFGVSYGLIQARKAQRRVLESEKKYRLLFENAPAGMYELNLKTRKIVNVNEIMSRITGYSKTELLGMDLYDLLAEESRPRYLKRIEKVKARDKSLSPSVEYIIIRKDGQNRFILVQFDYIHSRDRAPGVQVVIQDVTEQKQLEELMIQSEKMLSVGGLAAGMAHEINNPLAGMMQSAQVIHNRLTKNIKANQRAAKEAGTTMESVFVFMEKRKILHLLENINDAGNRAGKIVSNMLSFARKSDSKRTEYFLDLLIDETLEMAQSDYSLIKKYDFKKIQIIREYSPDVRAVRCDKIKIEQVLLNIFKNACEAMALSPDPEFLPMIRICLSEVNGAACIEIEDNGPGMDADTRKRVFDPFFTTKDVDQGTGLGLSVSYFIIVDDHQGELSVESEIGKGTRFFIRLPFHPSDNSK